MKKIIILGSTGSIGTSALDVVSAHPEAYQVVGLSAQSNLDQLTAQAREFGVAGIAIANPPDGVSTQGMLTGPDAAAALVRQTEADIVLNGIAGAAGFLPSLATVRQGMTLALANKESLVIGGTFLKHEARKSGAEIIPVDSEHSAIFQCLQGEQRLAVKRLILTASGGPFRNRPLETFASITPAEALKHPTWAMGRRITIDSATMMNKALEMIEAAWLFDISMEHIDVTIHPQSIIHSMVEFTDTSMKAQMGLPDMRLPIAYALTWPERIELPWPRMDFKQSFALEFFPPDEKKFRALTIARNVMQRPETWPCIMNAADETAIAAFLSGRITFNRITEIVEKTIDSLSSEEAGSPEDLLALDRKARITAEGLIT